MPFANNVILMGNVTRDIEVKYLQSGTAVTEIGMAINDKRKNQAGEWVEETTFVDVTLWGRTAEVAGEYCKKGDPLYIEGRLKTDTWEKDGRKQSKLKVVGERLQLLSTRGEAKPPYREERPPLPRNDNKRPPNSRAEVGADDDDTPF